MRLEEVKRLCENWDESDEKFAKIIDTATKTLGLYQRDLASEFEVAESTVSRWATGVARPHPRLQRLIVAFLSRRVARSLKQQLAASGS